MLEEYFDIYDAQGNHTGTAPRRLCHGNPALIHRTAHVVVIDPETGNILLQKRNMTKDIQPGKWDTAVGGHLALGEDFETGAKRELAEELGIDDAELFHIFDSKIRNEHTVYRRLYRVHIFTWRSGSGPCRRNRGNIAVMIRRGLEDSLIRILPDICIPVLRLC